MTAEVAGFPGGAAGFPGDAVELRGLCLSVFCGVLPEETTRRQPVEVDLDVFADLAPAGSSDQLGDTVDYGQLCDAIAEVGHTERFALLERFAQRVAEVALGDARVAGCTVAVRKLRPPVPQLLATSGVRITRWRTGGAGSPADS